MRKDRKKQSQRYPESEGKVDKDDPIQEAALELILGFKVQLLPGSGTSDSLPFQKFTTGVTVAATTTKTSQAKNR